jgi:hypothetical protein
VGRPEKVNSVTDPTPLPLLGLASLEQKMRRTRGETSSSRRPSSRSHGSGSRPSSDTTAEKNQVQHQKAGPSERQTSSSSNLSRSRRPSTSNSTEQRNDEASHQKTPSQQQQHQHQQYDFGGSSAAQHASLSHYSSQHVSSAQDYHHQQDQGVGLTSYASDQSNDADTVDKEGPHGAGGLGYDELSITSFYSDADGIIQVAKHANFKAAQQQQQGSQYGSGSSGMPFAPSMTPAAASSGLYSSYNNNTPTAKAHHHPWVEESPIIPAGRNPYADPYYSNTMDNHGGKKGQSSKSSSSRKKKGSSSRRHASVNSATSSKRSSKNKKRSGMNGTDNKTSSISQVYGNGGVIYDQTEHDGEGGGYDSSSTSADSSDDEGGKKSYRSKNGDNSTATSSGQTGFANSWKAPTVVQGVTALSAAAITGGILLGPVGVLLGAGALVAAAGYQSLPEEQREQIQRETQQKLTESYDFGEKLSDKLGNSCAVAFEKTGDVIGCHNGGNQGNQPGSSTRFGVLVHPSMGTDGPGDGGRYTSPHDMDGYPSSPDLLHISTVPGTDKNKGNQSQGSVKGLPSPHNRQQKSQTMPSTMSNSLGQPPLSARSGSAFTSQNQRPDEDMSKLIASSRRTVRPALPVSQIHALEPQFRPRAWLDLMCDPYSSPEDKNEAMEEILILAKDKHHGQMFLEEGILDALLTILNRFFKLHHTVLEKRETDPASDETLQLMDESIRLHQPSVLAASLSVALGKAHCAVVHTEGDLLLMSSYKQGTVPEGRQLAQMLYEIPHRSVVLTDTGLANNPITGRRYRRSDDVAQNSVRYRVKEMSLEEAEGLAKMIKDLTEGKMNPRLCK